MAGEMSDVFNAALEIVIVFAIAFIMKFLGYCNQDTAKKVIEVVVLYLVPMSIIKYIPLVQFQLEWMVMPIAPLAYMAITLPILRQIFKCVFPNLPRHDRGQLLLCCTGHAVTLVGYPIVRGIYGEGALALCAAWDLAGFCVAYISTYIIAGVYAPENTPTLKEDTPRTARNTQFMAQVGAIVAQAPLVLSNPDEAAGGAGAVFKDPVLRGHGARRLDEARKGLIDEDTVNWLSSMSRQASRAEVDANRSEADPEENGPRSRASSKDAQESRPRASSKDAQESRSRASSRDVQDMSSAAAASASPKVGDETTASAPATVGANQGASSSSASTAEDGIVVDIDLEQGGGTTPGDGSTAIGDDSVYEDFTTLDLAEGRQPDCGKVAFGCTWLLGRILLKVAKMPVTLAFFIGVIMRSFSVTSEDFPVVLGQVVHKSAACTQIVTIFGLGLFFQPELLLQRKYTNRLLVLLGCKYFFGIAIGLAMYMALGSFDPLIPTVLCIALIMPTPPVVIAYAGEYGYDLSFAALVVNASLLSSFILAFALALVLPFLR